ncbi:MAG: hypothetical protein WA843_02960 [Candidatus Saccharimonadales bacterium]
MSKADLRQFDYEKVATHDTNMWRAYYNQNYIKLFGELVLLTKEQMGLPWLSTLRAGYYSARAAADFQITKGREDYARILRNVTKFYCLVSDNCSEPFDFDRAAELEVEWWDIHRYPNKYERTLEQSLADNMAVLYQTDASNLEEYAHYRAAAMLLPKRYDKQEALVERQTIYGLLVRSWQSLHHNVQV